jgi:hypothetical protein
MEAPATSSSGSDPASDASMVEGEDLHRRVFKLVVPQSDQLAGPGVHPSHPEQASDPSALVRSTPDIDLRRRIPPITCTACRVTYLRPIGSGASAPEADWICPLCLDERVGEARQGVGEFVPAEKPPE